MAILKNFLLPSMYKEWQLLIYYLYSFIYRVCSHPLSNESLEQLKEMLPLLKFYYSLEEIKRAIEAILITDPRSIFIRKSFGDDIYGFCIDILNVLCKFGEKDVTVVGFEDWSNKVPKRRTDKVDLHDEPCDPQKLFFELHRGMAKECPGSIATTKKALTIALIHIKSQLLTHPQVLDVGCGPGMQTIELARNLQTAQIIGLDTHKDFLQEVKRRAKKDSESTGERVSVVEGSMMDLKDIFKEKMFDIIWSEGAIYLQGFYEGLCQWKDLVVPGGVIVVSELSWLKPLDEIPEEPKNYWLSDYPKMRTLKENIDVVNSIEGLQMMEHFILPNFDWWKHYYNSLEKGILHLRKKYEGKTKWQMELDNHQKEIDMFSRYSDCYGYVFFIIKKNDKF